MRKYALGLLWLICFIGCSRNSCGHKDSAEDSVVVVAIGDNLKFSLDSFEQIKDSFIYVTDPNYSDDFWCTKEYHRWNYEYPDTIKVAFTRNGVFVDSVECVRQGLVEDSNGNTYSPAYIYWGMTGDNWTYDVNGKFIEFNCVVYPHSGAPHHYKP